MNKKIFIPILGLLMLIAIVGTANADTTTSVEIRDSGGNLINDQTVTIGTTVHAYGYYKDQSGKSATALMEVYYSIDNVTFTKEAEIFSGTVYSGENKSAGPYTMTKLGFYEFRWTCEIPNGTIWCPQTTQVRTKIQLVIPEPATIAGLLMALSAFGLLAFKKTRSK
jgi:hypothetical protein